MENIKIGYIGLGCRGKDLLENIVLAQKEQVDRKSTRLNSSHIL